MEKNDGEMNGLNWKKKKERMKWWAEQTQANRSTKTNGKKNS